MTDRHSDFSGACFWYIVILYIVFLVREVALLIIVFLLSEGALFIEKRAEMLRGSRPGAGRGHIECEKNPQKIQ